MFEFHVPPNGAELAVVLNQARRKMRRDPIAAPRQPLAHRKRGKHPLPRRRGDRDLYVARNVRAELVHDAGGREDLVPRLAEVEGERLPDVLVD